MVDLSTRPPRTPFGDAVALRALRSTELGGVALFRLSRGKVAGSIFGAPVVLLTASGRVTGRRRTKPLLALDEGASWVVVGSRGGSATHPEWYLNLLAYARDPSASHLRPPTVEVAGEEPVEVSPQDVTGDEHPRVWQQVVSIYPRFASYQARAGDRLIPLVRLTPRHH